MSVKLCKWYEFECRFLNNAELPKWKGRILRGSIGYHMKKFSCPNPSMNCTSCTFFTKCPYGYIFRTRSKTLILSKLTGITEPYTLKPPVDRKTRYEKGDKLVFSVLLFGDACTYEEHLIRAVISMCNHGIGIKNSLGKLVLERVTCVNPFTRKKEVVFEGNSYCPTSNSSYIKLSHLDKESINRTFTMRFITPVRIVKNNALITELDFRTLFSFMRRKYSNILFNYVYRVEDLVDIPERVMLVTSKLSRITYIYKGKKEYYLKGEVVYHGRMNKKQRRVVNFCKLCHIGKKASFGFGWYELS